MDWRERAALSECVYCKAIHEIFVALFRIGFEIRLDLVHKGVAVFGMAIFLQCSIDFILSVGLSAEVSSTNFPATLGSMLARMDSKQDILAIGSLFSDVGSFSRLFTEHLQGVSVAAVIVFTLLCVYQISNGFVKRHSL